MAEQDAIPPFPLPVYVYGIDRIRHWMALQEDDAVFSSTEIIAGAGSSTSNAIYRLADKGELTRQDGGFKKGRISTTWDSWKKDQARREALVAKFDLLLSSTLENRIADAVAAERDRCAKIAEDELSQVWPICGCGTEIARKIRTTPKKPLEGKTR